MRAGFAGIFGLMTAGYLLGGPAKTLSRAVFFPVPSMIEGAKDGVGGPSSQRKIDDSLLAGVRFLAAY